MNELLDMVDAMVFSGCDLIKPENLNEFETYLARWTREVASIRETLKDEGGEA